MYNLDNGLSMSEAEHNSAILESKRSELNSLKENLTLLESHGVINIDQIKNKIWNLENEILNLENRIKSVRDNSKDAEFNEVHGFKEKSNLYYARAESASITGDTVGDPLKDTSGPSLNILIKLSSILSVVFSPLFLGTSLFA